MLQLNKPVLNLRVTDRVWATLKFITSVSALVKRAGFPELHKCVLHF